MNKTSKVKSSSLHILITGGAGYIGSHAVLHALQNGHRVSVIDSLERGYFEAIERVEKLSGKTVEFYKADLRDKARTIELLNNIRPDIVIHFAAYKSVPESVLNPELYIENNVEATRNLLDAMVASNTSKIIFSSTATVYGNTTDLPITENTAVGPINPYGQTKLDMENLIGEYSQKFGFESIAFRYFNVVGAHESGFIGEDPSRCTNLIPVVLKHLSGKSDSIKIFGNEFDTKDGTQERDYIHVMDLVDAHIKAAEMDFAKGQLNIFNLSTGVSTSCLEIVKIAEKVSGKKANLIYAEPRLGDPVFSVASPKKANEILDWKAERSITQGIGDQWRWTVGNMEGYAK